MPGVNPFDPMLIVWGDNGSGQNTVPCDFTGVLAMAGGGGSGAGGFSLVMTNQGRVVAWGANNYYQTNVPSGLSNVVAVAAGGDQARGAQSRWHRGPVGPDIRCRPD